MSTTPDDLNRFAPPTAEVADIPVVGIDLRAGRGRRFVAVMIDGLIQGAIYWVIVYAAFASLRPTSTFSLSTFFVQLASSFAIFLVVQSWFLAKDGQTLGKKMLGVRIVRGNGERASLGRLLVLRYGLGWAIALIPFIGALYTLVDSLLIFRNSRRCLHDDIADTIVVNA